MLVVAQGRHSLYLRGVEATRLSEAERRRQQALVRALRREYPDPECELDHDGPFQLLIATILSAQCTDERVNKVTPGLFEKWGTPVILAEVPIPLIEEEIHSTGFYRNKAKNIQQCSQMIVERFGGEVPDTMEGLVSLPGVARKTANVVLGTAMGKAEGIVVDTHVQRLSRRLGLTSEKDPVKVERELMSRFSRRNWVWLALALIWHGRRVCFARKPECVSCRLVRHCPSAETGAGG